MTEKLREWPVAEAKAKFSELVDAVEKNGPQMVTRRGKPSVVLVPADQWGGRDSKKYRNIKEWLLAPEARIEHLPVPDRKSYRWRKPPKL